MAENMKFELVSPEKRVASMRVTSVRIPGTEGDLTAMPDHAPVITTLRPGVLHAEGPDGTHEYVVTGGFAEIGIDGVSVLAEESHHRDDMTQEKIDRMVEEAARKHNKAKQNFENEPGPVDDAAKLLADMIAMGDHIGLSPKQPSL
ncbi:F0F1 ATP synthase subunit epsilon [Maribius pontilimi]|uniref:ATP synthase epsilon chain n=1 Tax=Palleronia pontilimi TaxID=1964209 RepID=A0A934II85_9RHOB|nr:F0F1 ATP synthase subunit epsilon [Palleronia pontilimi]MBJ3763408.1 F0F1 ATP synthase subunit epsilon [Palleronia pontilimi]